MTTFPALSSFGAGRLFGTRQDISGATPREFGVLQGVDFDFSFTTKPLFGTNQFAVFVARGEAKFTGKAKMGIMSGGLINDIFFGLTAAAGQTALQTDESHTIEASSPFTISVSPPNSGVFAQDEGVKYVGGFPFQLEQSLTAAAQYEQTNGLYTFSSLDASAAILISYQYTFNSAGQKIAITNQALGTTPYFSGVFRNKDPRTGLFDTLALNRMTSSKLTLSSKTSDYTIPEFDFEIMDDGTGNIGTMSFGDAS